MTDQINNLTNEIWKGAIKLRGKFKAYEYQAVILPMIMLRRIECVLISERNKIEQDFKKKHPNMSQSEIQKKVKQKEILTIPFHNESDWTLKKLLDENRTQLEKNFRDYLKHFSPAINEIIDKFNYRNMVTKIVEANRLDSIIELVAEEDFGPERLSNLEMGYVYEELLQRFSQDDAKDTGEHFTPREIIKVMVNLMEIKFDPKSSESISVYDPAAGTGGMLSVAKAHILENLSEKEKDLAQELILLFGQEYLPQNYAVCKTDMLLKGDVKANITHGNSLIPDIESSKEPGDKHFNEKFDYMLSNPPFGVDWGDYKSDVERLKTTRYKWGIPPKDDGALLFLLTMIEKMKSKEEGGSKIAILFNGSPLSSGDAGQAESEIRRHIIEHDLLDTIVMLPDEMFYNTGIYTYVWLLNNNKPAKKKGKVLIINSRAQHENELKSFGSKRNKITDENRKWIMEKYKKWESDDDCRIFEAKDFAFHKVNVIFWQTDEKGNKEYITESFDSKLNNSSVKKKFDLYGELKFKLLIKTPEGQKVETSLEYKGSESFETLLAEIMKNKLPQKLGQLSVKDIKKFISDCEIEAEYNHKHYIEDVEYIPEGKNIQEFLDEEIENEIILWEDSPQLGYEILPNSYFFKYKEPEKSDKLLEDFWKIEEQAEVILKKIKENGN